MSETRTYYPDESLKRLIIDNSDRPLILTLESLQRPIPLAVAKIIYQEFDNLDTQTFIISKTREQLLNLIDTYSYVYDYTYYETGEIDTIRTRIYDATAIKLSDTTLKHYLSGKQPEFI
jgi:hypothetical protein